MGPRVLLIIISSRMGHVINGIPSIIVIDRAGTLMGHRLQLVVSQPECRISLMAHSGIVASQGWTKQAA